MSRTRDRGTTPSEAVLPVHDLKGRSVWSETGDRLGTLRDVTTDVDGKIVSLDVQQRWMFGPHRTIPALGMRLDGSDVVVSPEAAAAATRGEERSRGASDGDASDSRAVRRDPVAGRDASMGSPVLLAGREGARERFGGLDLPASLMGALAAFAMLVLLGGILSAAFGLAADSVNFDTSLSSWNDLAVTALVVGAVTLFVSFLIGGWAAGRMARFDGLPNGIMTAVWVLLIGVALGAAGAWLGDEYDVFSSTNLPRFTTDEYATAGVVGLLGAIVLMVLGGALGGVLGAGWHRRVDRSMLDVVPVGGPLDAADRSETTTDADVLPPEDHTTARDRGVRRHVVRGSDEVRISDRAQSGDADRVWSKEPAPAPMADGSGDTTMVTGRTSSGANTHTPDGAGRLGSDEPGASPALRPIDGGSQDERDLTR